MMKQGDEKMRPAGVKQMLQTIKLECESTWRMTGQRELRPSVLQAMAGVPREEFVPLEIKPYAYDNRALPIGDGQTISQPFIVALMTDLLAPGKDHVVLEVGTGSGYQAAILATLVKTVFSIEIIPQLAAQAAERLSRQGYQNIKVIQGDGYQGLPEQAPFDGIIVTAAASHVPPRLKEQLKPGGNLVIPVGLPYAHQELMLVNKDRKGQLRTRSVLDVAFVPLTGPYGKGGKGRITIL